MHRPKRPCARPGCPRLVLRGYCFHCRPAEITRQQSYERQRGNSSQRGYDQDWRAFRDWFLAQPENKICALCGCQPSTDVHHLKKLREYPELRLVPSNCRGLCHACHSSVTARGL